ncbi:MAG: hypothetical protein AAFZ87_17335 [Planctomycetota bacterium]
MSFTIDPRALTALALALAPAADAANVTIEAQSTVAVASVGAGSAFAGVQAGDPVLVVLHVVTPGTDIAPGQFTRYDLDAASSTVTVGGVMQTLGSGTVAIQNDFPVADGIRQGGGPLPGGETLTLDVSQSSGTIFSSTDILANTGTWGPSTWASFQFTITGGGTFIEFDLPTITIDQGSILTTNFCPQPTNSSGASATISAFGTTDLAQNDVTLVASDVPAGQFGIFLNSTTPTSTPLGAGFLCLGGQIGRFNGPSQIQQADAAGAFELRLDLTQVPTPSALVAVQSGETWYYQAWFRDVPVSGSAFGLTDAMSVFYP